MRKAIVTLVIGEPYSSLFRDHARLLWEEYARKHGYELIVLAELLDTSERGLDRPPHWQKLIALSDPRFMVYDRLVWIDSDVVVNPHLAPDICADCPPAMVGVVSDLSQPACSELRSIANVMPTFADIKAIDALAARKCPEEARRAFHLAQKSPEVQTVALRQDIFAREMAKRNISVDSPILFNSGVLVTTPREHATLFRKIYDEYENIFQPLNDNIPLVLELNKHNVVHSLDSRFNVLFGYELFEHYPFLLFATQESQSLIHLAVDTIFMRSFFLHFAATYSYMPFLSGGSFHWLDLMALGLKPNLLYPNRDFAQEQFLELPHAEMPLSVNQMPNCGERNYRARYAANKSSHTNDHGQLESRFDSQTPAIGFHNVEWLPSGRPVRWTGKSSYCCFVVETPCVHASKFMLMITYAAHRKIAEGVRVSVNGVRCDGVSLRSASEYKGYFADDENLLIEGKMPEGVNAPYCFRLTHPFLTARREATPADTRQLGLALTRVIIE